NGCPRTARQLPEAHQALPRRVKKIARGAFGPRLQVVAVQYAGLDAQRDGDPASHGKERLQHRILLRRKSRKAVDPNFGAPHDRGLEDRLRSQIERAVRIAKPLADKLLVRLVEEGDVVQFGGNHLVTLEKLLHRPQALWRLTM